MRRLLIISFLILNFTILTTYTSLATNISRLKDININEFNNKIELNLRSSEHISYNILNYMNGDIGIKLLNTSLDSKNNSNNVINISNKDLLEEAQIIEDGPYSLEIKLKGKNDLSNKAIIVNNDVIKSNIILIEPAKEDDFYPIMPVVADIKSMPEIKSLEYEKINEQLNLAPPEIKQPIAMFSQEKTLNSIKGKRLIAQTPPYNDDTSILDIENEGFDEPLSSTTTQPKEDDNVSASSTSSSVVPEDQTKDVLDVKEIEEPEVVEAKDPDFFSKATNFVKTNILWIGIIGGCPIVLLIILVVVGTVFNRTRGPEKVIEDDENYETDEQPEAQGQQQKPIIDNEPVKYIPPSQIPNSQSISEAIGNIISIRNKSGK
ncbi:MAG: hypothetical protein AB1782_10660 [Cyanobacteriota bacterium]